MDKWIAYYRVSTKGQGRSGLGLEAQRAAVSTFMSGPPIEEFTEVESGKSDARPQLVEALRLAKLTGSTLIVAKLDRLSRNAAFLNALFDSGQPVAFADMPNADRFTLGIMAQLAQWELDRISRRTKEALAAAKARGTKLGGDRGNLAALGDRGRARSIVVRRATAAQRRADIMPYVDAAKAAGADSLADIARYLNFRQITTARGGVWHPASVARLLA